MGLAVAASGLTSMATQANVVAANLQSAFGFMQVPLSMIAIGCLLFLAGVAFRSIKESLWFNVLCTTVEAFGLLLVIVTGISYWGDRNS